MVLIQEKLTNKNLNLNNYFINFISFYRQNNKYVVS